MSKTPRACIARAVAYAPHCDLNLVRNLETRSRPPVSSPRACNKYHPAKLLAFTTARRRFNWKKHLDDAPTIPAKFHAANFGAMGLQVASSSPPRGLSTSLNHGMFELAAATRTGDVGLIRSSAGGGNLLRVVNGYTATKHSARSLARLISDAGFDCDHRPASPSTTAIGRTPPIGPVQAGAECNPTRPHRLTPTRGGLETPSATRSQKTPSRGEMHMDPRPAQGPRQEEQSSRWMQTSRQRSAARPTICTALNNSANEGRSTPAVSWSFVASRPPPWRRRQLGRTC